MPTYDYRCSACEHVEEKFHSIKEDPVFSCPICDMMGERIVMERLISGGAGFILGSTGSMGWKEKRLRHKRNAERGVSEVEHWGSGPRLQPNVAGFEVDSWSDAAKLAKEAGMNTDSYQPQINKEKHSSKSSGVDERAWKKAKGDKDKS